MEQAATEAGNILLNYYKKNLTLNYKTSHKDFYTIADVESQKAVKETITKLLLKKGINESEIGFIGEENLSSGNDKKHLFVIGAEVSNPKEGGKPLKKTVSEMDLGDGPYWVSLMGER